MSEIVSFSTNMMNLAEINENIVRYKVPIAYEGIVNKFDFSKKVLESMKNTIKGDQSVAYKL